MPKAAQSRSGWRDVSGLPWRDRSSVEWVLKHGLHYAICVITPCAISVRLCLLPSRDASHHGSMWAQLHGICDSSCCVLVAAASWVL